MREGNKMDIIFNELIGDHVRIVPLEKKYLHDLYHISKEESIWAHLPKMIKTVEDMESLIEEAMYKKMDGTEFPFVILLRENNKVIGSTRFLSISSSHRNLEIGWTWLCPSVWGTKINIECKYLLLKYCFEKMKMIRVQLKTDERNIRSQKAIERIGGLKEGVLRNHMIRKDGSFRNSVFYSIIDNEWPSVKRKLEILLNTK